jgi:preprotein translocase subunit SecB
MANRALVEMISGSGGRLLYSYLRELVSSVSSRGVYGPVFLDPVSVGPILTTEQIADVPEGSSEDQ